MHPSIIEDRVKPCMSCDAIIPFTSEECPSCNASVPLSYSESCHRCSAHVEPEAIFCPNCGKLIVSIGVIPELNEKGCDSTSLRGRSLELGITCLECVTMLAILWIIFDHLTL